MKYSNSLNILVIDDQDVCLLAAEICLVSTPHNVIKAISGEAGLKYMIENPSGVNIVILDIMMPGMDGIEVLKIMKNKHLSHIPVIIGTASHLDHYVEKAFSLGAKYYLRKPYTKKTLIQYVNLILDNMRK